MPTVTVSIINYRTADMTIACCEAMLADLDAIPDDAGVEAEIVVIDNGSGDGSDTTLQAWIDARPGAPLRLMRSPTNSGFAGGHNQVLAETASDYVLLLNSDAVVRPGCLAALVQAAEQAPRAGILSAAIEDETGALQTSCHRFHRAASEIIRGANLGPVTRLLKSWDMPLGPTPDPARIEWVTFACVLLRRAMVDEIGPMDDGYFLYFEDAEYCSRASRSGWGVRHVPSARALHREGGSGPAVARRAAKARVPAYVYASRTRYFYQRGGRLAVLAANAGWMVGRVLALGRLVTGRYHRAAAGEWRDIWINFAAPLGPRRAPGEDAGAPAASATQTPVVQADA